MNLWKTGGAAALGLAALVSGAATHFPARAQGEPAWMTDYAAAQAEARRSGKPVFVVFR